MANRIRLFKIPRKLTADHFAAISFIAYFAAPLIRSVFNMLFKPLVGDSLGDEISWIVVLICIYLPLVIACIMDPRRHVIPDYIVLLALICFFFAFSQFLHPDYAYWYGRSDYGAWNMVLKPTEGVHAYLFVRLINDPEKVKRYMKAAGWMMFVFFAYQVLVFLQRGYWIGIMGLNNEAEMDHSVSFGYNVMLFTLFFAYDALKYRRPLDIVAVAISLFFVFMGGTRGPVVFIAAFFGLYAFKYYLDSKKKFWVTLALSLLLIILLVFYRQILALLSRLFSRFGTTGRIFNTLLNGTFTNDAGRSNIWRAAVDMIRANPWGYGAMGSQPVISKIIYVGYPHSIILEILIDFGVVLGGVLLVALFFNTMSMLFGKANETWSGVFLCFFGTACQLFISMCFWSSPPFWACIGVSVCSSISHRKRKSLRMLPGSTMGISFSSRR